MYLVEYLVFNARVKQDKTKYSINIYTEKPKQNIDFDLALKIYNAISNNEQSIDWSGFQILCDMYDVEDSKIFAEYIMTIKTTIANFDEIYQNKCSNDKVASLQKYVNDNNKKKKINDRSKNKNR